MTTGMSAPPMEAVICTPMMDDNVAAVPEIHNIENKNY